MIKNEKIKETIKNTKGLSKYKLAAKLGITPQGCGQMLDLSDLEGHYNRIKTISEYLDVPMGELFD